MRAGFGTEFAVDPRSDMVRITSPDGAELEVPGPDLRELLETLRPEAVAASSHLYQAALDKAQAGVQGVQRRVRREFRDAPRALAELLSEPESSRPRRIRADRRFRTPPVVYLALENAREAIHDDLREAAVLADVACQLSLRLDPRDHGGARVRDIQAYAESVRGNVRRVSGDLRASRESFRAAREYLALGDLSSDEAIEVDRLETSLLRDLRDYSGSLALSARVVEALLEKGETASAVRALLQRASVLEEMNEPAQAIEAFRAAAALTDGAKPDKTTLTIHHGLAVCLARLGRVEEAREVFERAQPLYAESSGPLAEARRRWAEGIIALEGEAFAEAVASLRQGREIFAEAGYNLDLALISLDLAAVLVALGQPAEAGDLAEATYRYMEVQEDAHPDALAALAVFRQAAVQESLTRDLLSSLARRLQLAPTTPPPAS